MGICQYKKFTFWDYLERGKMTITERMFELLKERNAKAKDLCDFLGINGSTMTNWKKRGTTPPAEFIIPICKFLNISVYELLGEENENDLERIYNQLAPADKAIVDNIFDRYREHAALPKSSDCKIG